MAVDPVQDTAPLAAENARLRERVQELEETLAALRDGTADALVTAAGGLLSVNAAPDMYRAFLEGMSEGVLRLDSAGIILFANQRFAAMLKVPLREIIGTRLGDWLSPRDKSRTAELLATVTPSRVQGNVTLVASDGQEVQAQLSVSLLQAGDSRYKTTADFAIVVTDLTEKRRDEAREASDRATRLAMLSIIEDEQLAAQELREAQQRLNGILSSISQVVWSMDATTSKLLYISPAVEAIYGRTAEAFRDTPGLWMDVVVPEDRPLADAMHRQLLEQGKSIAEFRILRPDGEMRWIRNEASVARNDAGIIVRLDGVVSDTTLRRRAEQALAESEVQFRSIVEQSIAGFYITQDGKLAYVNSRFAEILGYASPEELVGRETLTLVPEDERDRVAENFRLRLSGQVRQINYTTRALRKDGSVIELEAHGTVATFRGKPAIIGLTQDVSEKKRAQEQIERYLRQVEAAFMHTVEVAMNLSELRDPYTAGHEKRVAQIAVAIGTELGWDASRLEGLRVAGYLHDIGKITVPTEILAKPGRLTPTEHLIIRQHAQAGYDVLKNVEFPWPVAQCALQHHERLDGSGYPNGLKGEAIALEARIIAVADTLEAMSSHRPYRPAIGIEAALAEIERGSGTAYDPSVASAALRLFREKSYTLPALSALSWRRFSFSQTMRR